MALALNLDYVTSLDFSSYKNDPGVVEGAHVLFLEDLLVVLVPDASCDVDYFVELLVIKDEHASLEVVGFLAHYLLFLIMYIIIIPMQIWLLPQILFRPQLILLLIFSVPKVIKGIPLSLLVLILGFRLGVFFVLHVEI